METFTDERCTLCGYGDGKTTRQVRQHVRWHTSSSSTKRGWVQSVSMAMARKYPDSRCPECGKQFNTPLQANGHVSSAHLPHKRRKDAGSSRSGSLIGSFITEWSALQDRVTTAANREFVLQRRVESLQGINAELEETNRRLNVQITRLRNAFLEEK